MPKKNKDWHFVEYEHGGEVFKAMYEHSDGCVSARLFIATLGDWSHELVTQHHGPNPIQTARMLFREIADAQLKTN